MAARTYKDMYGAEWDPKDAGFFDAILGPIVGGSKTLLEYTPEQINVDRGAAQFANADQYRSQMQNMIGSAQGRQADQMQSAQIATGPQSQARGDQRALADALVAAGRQGGPSVADAQMRQALAQQNAAAMSGAKSMRGVNPALAQSLAANQMANNQAQTLAQAQVGRLQERQQDRQNLLGALQGAAGIQGQVRGADIGLAGQQAGLEQQANQANLSASMQQRGLNDARQQNLLNSLLGMEGQIQSGNITLEQARLQGEAQERQNQLNAAIANQQAQQDSGGVLGMLRGL